MRQPLFTPGWCSIPRGSFSQVIRRNMTWGRGSAKEPHRHTRLENSWIALWIEAQAQRVAVVAAGGALGLPGRERAERPKLGDDGRHRFAAAGARDIHLR